MGYSKAGYIFPPYDLAMIAAILREDGFNVKIVDANAKRLSLDDVGGIIEKEKPHYVVFSNSTPTIDFDLNIPPIAKSVDKNITTVTFGPHVSTLHDEVMSSCHQLDVVVLNEQELTIKELISSGKTNVKGTLVRDGVKLSDNGLREPLANFDRLPYPAHDLLELGLYKLPYARRYPATATMTSRGCPYSCVFCASILISKKFMPRSVEHVLSELKFLSNELGVHEIKFWDDTFTLDKQRVSDICDGITSEKLDLSWTCNTRVDRIDEELLSEMKKAGCHTVCMGVESGDERVLESLGKNITIRQIKEGFRAAKKVGIDTVGFFMFGHPDDTKESMKKTIDLAIELNPDIASFNITTPFPGTALYDTAAKNRWLKTRDWSKYESTSYPVYETPNAARDEVYEMFKKAYRKYYFRPSYILGRIRSLSSIHDLIRDASSALGLLGMLHESE
jgi:radical SAM superfamily enzyme YgiQ (UPF0313 family)